MLKLYYSPQSCSLIPHIFLEELKSDYETELVDVKTQQNKKAQFLKINPRGKIPALAHNQRIITETVAIINYLADIHDETNFFPQKDISQKTANLEWMLYFATSVHNAFLRLFRPNYFIIEKKDYSLVQQFADKEIEKILTTVDTHLENQSYLNGEVLQICDVYFFNYGRWGNLANKPTKDYTNLSRFMNQVAETASVTKILKKEAIGLYREQKPVIL